MPVILLAGVDVGNVHFQYRPSKALMASMTPTETNESPAGLMMMASASSRADWIRSMMTPSWFD
jgi:hypothetical protein